jgi:hypothetical protein
MNTVTLKLFGRLRDFGKFRELGNSPKVQVDNSTPYLSRIASSYTAYLERFAHISRPEQFPYRGAVGRRVGHRPGQGSWLSSLRCVILQLTAQTVSKRTS